MFTKNKFPGGNFLNVHTVCHATYGLKCQDFLHWKGYLMLLKMFIVIKIGLICHFEDDILQISSMHHCIPEETM